MEEYLTKLKLKDYLRVELQMDKIEFVKRFRTKVDEAEITSLSDWIAWHSFSGNEFKGTIDHNGFKIKRHRRLFDSNGYLATAVGIFRTQGDALIIEIEINSFPSIMVAVLVVMMLLLGFSISIILRQGESVQTFPWFFWPFVLFALVLLLGIPYLVMRSSTSRMKEKLERVFGEMGGRSKEAW